jgi:hypothetical protein
VDSQALGVQLGFRASAIAYLQTVTIGMIRAIHLVSRLRYRLTWRLRS